MTRDARWCHERAYRLDGTPYVRLTLRAATQRELIWAAPVPLRPHEVDECHTLLCEMRAGGWTVPDPPDWESARETNMPDPARRLATLERQLQRYLARVLPPATSALQARRRQTFRRRVIRDNLRAQRCLRETGTEVGWRAHPLTAEDEARAEALLADGGA